jgi:hypothetical protein
MSEKFTIEGIGTFHESDGDWMFYCDEPAFEVFNYEDAFFDDDNPHSLEIVIETITKGEKPAREAVDAILEVWSQRTTIPEKVCNHLWGEITGKIPTQYWWADDSQWESNPVNRPISANALKEQLGLDTILCRYVPAQSASANSIINPFTGTPVEVRSAAISRPGFWYVELSFSASFENEHGVSVYWHRNRIIGSGYCSDPPPENYDPTS